MQKEKKLFYKYVSETMGKNDFTLKERMLYGAGKNCFPTKEEATIHFEESRKIALDRYQKIIDGIEKLKEALGDFSYSYFIDGDTHGIYDEGLYMEIDVNGYTFQFLQY